VPLTGVLACDGGGYSFLQPPKDLQNVVGTDSKVDKGQPVQDNCVGPRCARHSNPSPFSLLSADSEVVNSKKPRKSAGQ
jgi:hypothetical protein